MTWLGVIGVLYIFDLLMFLSALPSLTGWLLDKLGL